MKKVFSIVLTIAMMVSMMSCVLASGGNTSFPSIGDAKMDSNITDLTGQVLGIIQWIGYAFAIGMLLYIGIKYMMSAANEKADMKKALIGYVIGAIILFAASTIVGAIQGMF